MNEIRKTVSAKKLRVHDDLNSGKVIVVMSAAETEPPIDNKHLVKREIDDVDRHDDATFPVHCPMNKNLDGNDNDEDKENAVEKRIPSKSKLSRGNREADKIFSPQQRTRANRSPRPPRPANAFMLFANEWRKKIAAENPRESNKDISVRLVFSQKRRSPPAEFISPTDLSREPANLGSRKTISSEIRTSVNDRSREFATCCSGLQVFLVRIIRSSQVGTRLLQCWDYGKGINAWTITHGRDIMVYILFV